MIDEDHMLQLYGYTSDELKPQSNKPIIAVCEECGKYRITTKNAYRELCYDCGHRGCGHPQSAETKEKISAANEGKTYKARNKEMTLAHRIHISATRQGISYEEWDGFSEEQKYCHRFNESCRERNREKYGRVCFICGKDETDNGRKLSVHHVDMSRSQGCNGEKWKLVPLCKSCHGIAHSGTWMSRIEYLLKS